MNCVTGMAGRALNAGRIQTTTKCELNSSQIMATAEPLLTGLFIFSKLISRQFFLQQMFTTACLVLFPTSRDDKVIFIIYNFISTMGMIVRVNVVWNR